MCREREVDRQQQRGGTDIGTLTSVQPPPGKEQGSRSPKPSSNVLSVKLLAAAISDKEEQERVVNEREGGLRPLVPRRTTTLSPRLLPYFPKPGVTSPPPPQSLARNAEPVKVIAKLSPLSKPPSGTRNPSPAPASRATARNPSPVPVSRATARNPSPSASRNSLVQPQVPSSALRATGGVNALGAAKTTARNSSPSPSTRTVTLPSKATGHNQSPAPVSATPAARNTARNPSPTTSSRVTARNPSPAPVLRASPRNPSPASRPRVASQGTTPPAISNEGDSTGSPLVPASVNRIVSTTKRSSSPALFRKDSSRLVFSENGSKVSSAEIAIKASPLNAFLPSVKLMPSIKSSLDLSKSHRKEGIAPPESPTFSVVKKLNAAELQALKRDRIAGYGRKVGTPKGGRVACEGMLPTSPVPVPSDFKKRCHWVTPQSEPDLVSYHDEVWGVPVHDDKLLFELLVLEGSQAELSRPQILSMREYFREVLGGFDPEIVAKFDEKKIATLKGDDVIRQPEAKIRGVIENARQLLKVVEEFGSFDRYLWNFVGFKPIVNTPRIFTQIPVKSSKSEALSKDLMRRGFRYVGPTTIYSFMQAAGMVNDHLVTCYRHSECCAISQMQEMDNSSGHKRALPH